MLKFFSSYLYNFLSISICAFICETASSLSEKGKSLSKVLSLICALCVFLAATFPILSIIKLFPKQIDNTESNSKQETEFGAHQFINLTKKQLEEETTHNIYSNTGILIDEISINLSIEENEFIINSIEVSAKKYTGNEKSTIRERLQTLFGNETPIEFTE